MITIIKQVLSRNQLPHSVKEKVDQYVFTAVCTGDCWQVLDLFALIVRTIDLEYC